MVNSWHRPFANMLEQLLKPVKIKVEAEAPIMARPPESDVLLMLNQGPPNPEQKARLCDGLRDCRASHILIEFKYTEAVNAAALKKALGYDVWYRESKDLKVSEHQTFIVSSRTPSSKAVENAGYQWSQAGVMTSQVTGYSDVSIISLNDLPDTSYNALFKVFASKRKQKVVAFDRIIEDGRDFLNHQLERQVASLFEIMLKKEYVMTTGSALADLQRIENSLTDMIMKRLRPEECMRYFTPQERLQGLNPQERLKGLDPQERLQGLDPQEVLQGLDLQDLSDEEVLHILEARKKARG